MLLLALAGLGLAWLLADSGDRGRFEETGGPERPAGDPVGVPTLDPRERTPAGPGTAPPGPGPATLHLPPEHGTGDGAGATPGPSFSGPPGRLRGRVEARGVDAFPRRWTLHLQPSRILQGRERAVERWIEFENGEQEFVVEDLPLAGYDVEARAPGLNGLVQPILLTRGNSQPFVNLWMTPAGFLEGVLVDRTGAPAEGVPMTLVALPEGQTRTALSDLTGTFRFDEVLDGPYELFLGRPESPLSAKRWPVRFQAPSLSLPTIELPPLAGLDVRVIDDLNRAIPDVLVKGSGNNGGAFEATTDADGRIAVRHLPGGRWRLRFEHPDYASSRVALPLENGQVAEHVWMLQP